MNIIDFESYKRGKRRMCKFVDELRLKPHEKAEDIIARAEEILSKYELDAGKAQVPIVRILNEMGIKTYQNNMAIKAYISVNPEYMERFGTTKIACVNSDITYGFKRFALAHELAHYLFDYDEATQPEYYNTYVSSEAENREAKEENRANIFARNLLMPREAFAAKYMELLGRTNSLPDTYAELAKFFGVEYRAVAKRVNEIGVAS